MFRLCLASFLHIFLNLCNFIFSFKLFLFYIYLSVHHLFFIIYSFIYLLSDLLSYLVEVCLETCLVEFSRESFMSTDFRSLDFENWNEIL